MPGMVGSDTDFDKRHTECMAYCGVGALERGSRNCCRGSFSFIDPRSFERCSVRWRGLFAHCVVPILGRTNRRAIKHRIVFSDYEWSRVNFTTSFLTFSGSVLTRFVISLILLILCKWSLEKFCSHGDALTIFQSSSFVLWISQKFFSDQIPCL